MRALIKNSKKIVLNQVDPSERALIDDFVRKSLKQATSIRSLYDIDNELDGVSFELTGKKPGTITFRTPCIQVVAVNGNIKIDGIETKVYTHPSYTAKASGLYKITTDATGHVSEATAVSKADITALGIPASSDFVEITEEFSNSLT